MEAPTRTKTMVRTAKSSASNGNEAKTKATWCPIKNAWVMNYRTKTNMNLAREQATSMFTLIHPESSGSHPTKTPEGQKGEWRGELVHSKERMVSVILHVIKGGLILLGEALRKMISFRSFQTNQHNRNTKLKNWARAGLDESYFEHQSRNLGTTWSALPISV